MTIARVVDTHVHHWSPQRADLFPFLVDEDNLKKMTGLADVSALRRPFDRETYLAESSRWNVQKYVHVSAAMGPDVSFVAETSEREAQAAETGRPNAIIGSIHGTASPAEISTELARQAESAHFRGVRVNMGIDHESEQARVLLRELQDRGLSYELWVHPPDMAGAAKVLEGYDRLDVVVGHMGWPLGTGAEQFEFWRSGMTTLAGLGDRVHCKLSGLVQEVKRFDADLFRPWIETAIEIFGDQRCFFGSNFPVDGSAGTFDELYSLYDELTAELDDAVRDRLFAANAEQFYRI
jgi:predicted TIM-barrel fold metal-dependent hydrolase